MKLCINPKCPSHCEVVQDTNGWRFAEGFQASLTKDQLKFFDPSRKSNFCQVCSNVRETFLQGELMENIKTALFHYAADERDCGLLARGALVLIDRARKGKD